MCSTVRAQLGSGAKSGAGKRVIRRNGEYGKNAIQRLRDVITVNNATEGDGGREEAAWLASQGQICPGLFK